MRRFTPTAHGTLRFASRRTTGLFRLLLTAVSFLLLATFRPNDLLWNGGREGCRMLVLNLGSYPCLWHLDCSWHDRRWLAFGLDAHGPTNRQIRTSPRCRPIRRCQNRVAVPVHN